MSDSVEVPAHELQPGHRLEDGRYVHDVRFSAETGTKVTMGDASGSTVIETFPVGAKVRLTP